MQLLKLFSFKVCALIFCLVVSVNTYSAKWATVVADKAVIYSDMQMSSKIGYIKKGKKVRVGEVARNNGKLLPIVINKKLAYIKIQDLQTSNRLEALQSASQRLRKQTKSETIKSNRVSLYSGSVISSVAFQEEVDSFQSLGVAFLGLGLRGYVLKPGSRTGYRAGIEYLSGSKESHTLNYINFSADYYYKLMTTSFADIYLYAGGSVLPYTEYKYKALWKLNGYGAGAQAGTELIFKYSDFALHLEGGYQYLYFTGLKINGNNDSYPAEINATSNGVKILGAISFLF